MRHLFTTALLLCSACDNYDPATSFGGGTEGSHSQWDDDLDAVAPGADPCVIIAQLSELALVDSTPLVLGSESEFTVAPDGATATLVSVVYAVDSLLGYWSLAPYGLRSPRPISALMTEISDPEETPGREGALVAIWIAVSGPAKLRQRHSGQYPPPNREWDFAPYATVGGDYKIGVVSIGYIEPVGFGGQWVIDTFPPVAKMLGAVRPATNPAVAKAHPPGVGGGDYFLSAWHNGYKWLPYGGVCYLGLPGGLDDGGDT